MYYIKENLVRLTSTQRELVRNKSLFQIHFSGIRQRGHKQSNEVFFDTLYVIPVAEHDASSIKARAQEKEINLRYFEDGAIGVALDETTKMEDVDDLLWIFDCQDVKKVLINL